MIVLPGRRFGVSTPTEIPRLVRSLAAVFSGDVDYMIDAAHDGDWARYRRFSARWSARVLEVTGTELDIVGLERVDAGEAYVVAALHEGFADILALFQLPVPLAWVARDELADWKRLDSFLGSPAALTIRPETPVSAMRSLLVGSPGVFESGRSLVVFPQGTLLGIEAAFTSGAFQIADRFRRPLLPIVITGSHRVYEYPFSPRVRFDQKIRMQILPPVTPGSARAQMKDVERRMRAAALSADPGPRRYSPERDGYWDDYTFEIASEFTELVDDVTAHRRALAAADEA